MGLQTGVGVERRRTAFRACTPPRADGHLPSDPGQFEIWRSNVRKAVLDSVDEFRRRSVRGRPAWRGRRCRRRRACRIRRRRQVSALDVHVPGLVVRRRGVPRRAARLREPGTAARVRAAAGRRHGRFAAAPRAGRPPTCSSPTGTATAGCPAAPSGSVSPPPSCSATCAWSGPNRCCATAASTTRALSRAWPRYDAMRSELAVGQFADLVNDVGGLPTLDEVLEVARRKSGNYTVRRPLEIGAAMAGCGEPLLTRLGAYGDAVGEAFQLRDDLLGIFGSPEITGKPVGADLDRAQGHQRRRRRAPHGRPVCAQPAGRADRAAPTSTRRISTGGAR